MKNYKFLDTGLRNLADATSFHGFNELYHAKTKFFKVIWIIILTVALVMTTYQVYGAVVNYMQSSSVTLISPVKPGELIYPPLDVCYIHWITWVNWKKALSLNFTKEMLLASFSFITNPVFSSTIFNIEQARKELLKTMALNNFTSVSQLYKSVARTFPMVLALLGGGVLVDDPPFFNNITFRSNNGDIYLCYTVSGREILEILNHNQQQASTVIRSGRTIFNFSIQDPTFARDYSYFMEPIEYDFRIGNWLSKKTNYWLPNISDYLKNYTVFTFPVRLYPDAYSDDYVEITKENDKYDIEMSPSVHRQMNTLNSPCIVGMKDIASEHQCEDICRATFEKSMNTCLSLPLAELIGEDGPTQMCWHTIKFVNLIISESGNTTSEQITTIPTFTTTHTSAMLEKSSYIRNIHIDYQTCLDGCDNPCEVWKYQFTTSITTLATDARRLSFKNQTDIHITYPSENDVLIMIDADARTWEDFVANVGGLLGVWTGASIISFIELAYLCCCKEITCEDFNWKTPLPVKANGILINNNPIRIESAGSSYSRNIPLFEVLPPPVTISLV